jgi:hypothetical protein
MVRPSVMCGILLLLVAFGRADAQVTTGSIRGTVKDASGGVLPGVSVTAINVGTNVSRSEVTNERGEYSLQFLPPVNSTSRR